MQIVIILQNYLILFSLILHPKLGGCDFFEKLYLFRSLFYLMAQPPKSSQSKSGRPMDSIYHTSQTFVPRQPPFGAVLVYVLKLMTNWLFKG